MKKILIPVLALLLLATVLLACSKEAQQPAKKGVDVSTYKSEGVYTDLGNDKLSQEGLAALPQKYAGMSPQEARETVVAFWRYCKTALWMPDEKYDIYEPEDDGDGKIWKRCVEPGGVYAGLPYKGTSTGNIYRLFDYMDPETGVVDVSEAGRNVLTFGGMCSSGCYWAWARVLNSADYRWCNDSVYSRGYLPVGPYTYDLSITKLINFDNELGTDDICRNNGEQVIYQSYAAMDIADGLIAVWEKNGHTMMCSVKPVVVYNEDGTINGQDSYLCVTEQGGSWDPGVSPSGIAYQYEYSLDKKFTFYKLFTSAYIPYTFGDLIGTDPIEETEVTFSHSGETITEKQLFSSKVSSNYHLSDIYVYAYDNAGTEVYKHAVRIRVPSTKEMKIHKQVDLTYTWGSWDNVKPGYKVKIAVRLGTGECPVVWEGVFAQGE